MSVITVEKNKDKQPEIIVNELSIRSVDRSRKDINSWRFAHVAAESVYYPNRSRLYDLYEDVLLDGHLSGIIAKRMDMVLNKPMRFENNGVAVPELDALINSQVFRTILGTIMQTKLWGISGLEFIPGKELAFKKVPRKHIKPNLGIIAYDQSGTDGINYEALPNLWIIGEPDDLGLLLKCAPYAIYKRSNLSEWAQYIEIFGQPVRIAKYDTYDEQTRLELKRMLDESGSSLSMMIPRQADFEMKDGKQTNGDGKLQQSFLNALNAEMSIIVLGNTETTTSSSSYAQSKVHQEQQNEIMRSDLIYAANMLNHPKFISVLRSYGYPVAAGKFSFIADTDLEYLSKRLAIDEKLATRIDISADYWHHTYGITKP